MAQEIYTAAFDEDDGMYDSRLQTFSTYCTPNYFQNINFYVQTGPETWFFE
jgi:hypothetical protein